MDDALAVAREEGREEEEKEIIQNALAKGYTPEIIHDITGFEMKTILELKGS